MSKRKILLLAMSVIMIAILAVGGTLAYFTSEDQADNVFTMGNVEIDLEENFDEDEADLEPGIAITKQVWIENTGSNDVYVRAHIAIPTNMDAQDPTKSGKDVMEYLHFVYGTDANWSWDKANGTDNFYTAKIDDVDYNVYVVTYQKALAADEKTGNAIEKVVLDVNVDGESNREGGKVVSYTYSDKNGHEVTLPIELVEEELAQVLIKVYAEGAQTGTFNNAYTALDTVFGVPGSAGYVAPWNK